MKLFRKSKRNAVFLCLLSLMGCSPVQPFFIHEDGDLSHYLDVAAEISYPDVDQPSLPDAEQTERPLSTQHAQFREPWKLTLEETMAIALQNSQVIRSLGQVRAFQSVGQTAGAPPENLSINPDFAPTIYDPAIQNTSNTGVEAALANFDAQLRSNFTWDRTDRPQNVNQQGETFFPFILAENNLNYRSEISKRTATGSQWFLRNVTTYESSNRPLRNLFSNWLTSFEAEVRQPLLRNSGVQINRIPVVLARLNMDVALTDFERTVRNFVLEVERGYWNLYYYYHALDAARRGAESSLATWRQTKTRRETGLERGDAASEAQARAQYFQFRSRLEQAQADLFHAESSLRYLMGIAATDGRLIHPIDAPTKARVEFGWSDIVSEALVRSPEIRRQQWRIKQQQLQLIAARNQLLPQFDIVALYRFLGLGDDLLRLGSRSEFNFPQVNSVAWDELTGGNFQEWQLGFQFQSTLGFRAELTTVRNQQLQLRRAEKRLQDSELELTHQLSAALRRLESQYDIAQTQFNTLLASRQQVEARRSAYEAGSLEAFLLLDAQRAQAQAEVDYFRALSEYNLAIVEVHYRKGSLLEFNGVALAEGPWPSKAYFDANTRARQRDASTYFDYGYTRPAVVSRGAVDQFMDKSAASLPAPTNANRGASDVTDAILAEPDLMGPELFIPENAPTPAENVDSIYGDLGL